MESKMCGKKYLFLQKQEGSRQVYAFLPALCKSWTCPKCRKVKAQLVKDFIIRSFKGQEMWLLSLTFFHSGTALEAWENVGKFCNRLFSYAHKYSGDFKYVRVVEPHADGLWPHVHILVNKPIASEAFVKLVTSWGFGWNFESQPIDSASGALYLSKYLTKEWPAGSATFYRQVTKTRIVSCSRSLGSIFEKPVTWRLLEYDNPKEQIEFTRNVLITECHKALCTFMLCSPVGDGFILETDVRIPADIISLFTEPYVWNYSKDSHYAYIPYGVQEELPF